jgi:baseplate J-like protein
MGFGVTADGFTRKTFVQIQSEMQAYVRAKISKHLQLTEKTGLGNVLNSAGDQIAEVWEAVEAAYHAADKDNALDDAFVALCELTGTKRRGATKGVVVATCTFDSVHVYAPGALVAHVNGFADNRWVNRDTITSTVGANVGLVFEAETAGAQGRCTTGTLTKIAQTATGWTAITNPAGSTDGEDIETIEALGVRREQELQRGGSSTLAAVKSTVSAVAGVIQVASVENKTDYATTIPPHSFRLIVWDGVAPAASNDEIAQAILNASVGIQSVGASSGTAVDADGLPELVFFDRAVGVPIYVSINVDGSTVDVADAIVTEGNKLKVGGDVIREKLKGAAIVLAGVDDIVTCTLGTSPAPVGTANIPMAIDQIPLFDAARVVVT